MARLHTWGFDCQEGWWQAQSSPSALGSLCIPPNGPPTPGPGSLGGLRELPQIRGTHNNPCLAVAASFLAGEAAWGGGETLHPTLEDGQQTFIGLKVSTPSMPATALRSNPLHCSGQNFPTSLSSHWKGRKSLQEAACVPLVFLSEARRAGMLKLSRRLGNCPPLIQARPVETLQVSKALIGPIRTLMTKSRIKVNRKKASLNKPKQETADFEKVK